MKNLKLKQDSRKRLRIKTSLHKDILKTIIFSLPILALGTSFIFAKTPNANADAASDIVVKITTQGTGYIKNVWNSTVNYTGTGTCPASGTLAAFARVDVSSCSANDTMTISEGTPGTSFRQWAENNIGQYAFFGKSNYEAGTARGEITQMPPMSSFTTDSTGTTAGDSFFANFNYRGSLTSLPAGSFNTSNITTAGDNFFNRFNSSGTLTSLPAGSFDTSNITTVGNNFFNGFNSFGALTLLPAGSFDTSNITTAGEYFFSAFNSSGNLTSLPDGSFNISKITTVGYSFFSDFNYYGALTSLPVGSFNISNITTAGDDFFSNFNYFGALTSLPAGSFNISNITTIGDYFFDGFNFNGKLTKSNTGIPIKNVSSNPVDFQYWNGSSSDTDTVNSGDTFEFYAVNAWNYTINADSGNLTGGTESGLVDKGDEITLPTTATREGYTFAGFTSSAWTGTKNLGETFTLTGDTEVTATWIKNSDPAPNPTPNPDNGAQTPAAPNTGSTNKLSGVTISGLIFASIIAAVALFAKFAHKTLKSER